METSEQTSNCKRAGSGARPWYCKLKSERVWQSGQRWHRQSRGNRPSENPHVDFDGLYTGLLTAAFGANAPFRVIKTAKMGMGLAACYATQAGEEIGRDRSVVAYATLRPSQLGGTLHPPQAVLDARRMFADVSDGDAAALVLAFLLRCQMKEGADREAGNVKDLMSKQRLFWESLAGRSLGPRHWLTLPGPRAKLQARAALVSKHLSQIGITHLSEDEVITADMQRIGTSVCLSGLLPLSLAGPVERSLGSPSVIAVALGCALLNHSCAPNAELRWDNGEVALIALQDIAVGQEVYISYINEMDNVLSRRYFLLEQYGFRCACKRCQANFNGNGDTLFGGWRCLECGDASSLSSEMLLCSKCNTIIDAETRQRREKADVMARQKVSQALGLVDHRPDAAAQCMDEGIAELVRVRPPGEPRVVKALALKAMLLAKLKRMTAAKATAADLQEQLMQQRRVILDEQSHDGGPQVERPIAGNAWQSRLVSALHLWELREGSSHKGTKRRLGRLEDGGYVVWVEPAQTTLCDVAWSYGVDTDISFERQLAANAVVHLFDHTVACLPSWHPNFIFHREALSDKVLPGVAGTLNSHFNLLNAASDQRLLLKMDVEGAEYSALLSADDGVISRIDQLCLELHWLLRPDRGGSFELKALALERIQKHFVLLHAHGNNYGDIGYCDGCELPDVLEVLYVNRRLLGDEDLQPNSRPLPDPQLDAQNCAFVPDVALNGAPFCHAG